MGKLPGDIGDDALHRFQVLRDNFVIFDSNAEMVLKVGNKFEGACGVDDIALKRRVVNERVGPAEQEVIDEESSEVAVDVCRIHLSEEPFVIRL